MANKNNIITEAQFRKILSESLKLALNEDAESSAMKAAIKFLIQQGQSKEQAQQIFNALRNDIPSINLPLYTNTNGKQKGTYKFAIGVERMYLNGELSDGPTILKLNKTLKLLAYGHADEYDANLNNMSAQELNRRFETAAASELQNDIDTVNSEEYTPNGYTVVRIPDFETAKEYGKYTSWCVTHSENMYNSYTGDGAGLFYFFLKNGFEQIKPIVGDGCPLDEYGLSMIAVSVDMDGSLNTVTCRWNYMNGGNNNVMDAKQLSRIVGMNVYSICNIREKGIIPFDEVQDLLDKGTPPEEIFDYMVDFNEGFAMVELRGKCNVINKERKLISNQWFDFAGDFNGGVAVVKLNDKLNFINKKGKLISKQWFDNVDNFNEGFARVELNEKYNFINKKGKLLSKQWFDNAGDFNYGAAEVKLNRKWCYIDTEGQIIDIIWESKTRKYMKQNKKTITESQLRKMIANSINEIYGWKLENDDITLVNNENDGRFRFLIKMWWGGGYTQDCYNAFANNEEEALNYTVAWIEQNHPMWLINTDRMAKNLKYQISQEQGMDIYDVEDTPEFQETFTYVDATMEGASEPHYIFSENLHVAKYPEQHNYPIALKEWRYSSPREEWVESFGEEYVQRLESPIGELLADAEAELGEVINFGRGYDGTSNNPIGWLSCYYCHDDISEKSTLRELISILHNYDMICVNEDGTIDVNESNHQELANRINQLMSGVVNESILKTTITKSLRKALKEGKKRETCNVGGVTFRKEKMDKNGNPRYSTDDERFKNYGRKHKDGRTYFQSYSLNNDVKNVTKVNESQLRKIVSETLKEMMGDDDFKKRWEELSMYTHHGNRNLYDLKGKAAMHALGDDKCMKDIALSDKGVGEYNPYDEEGDF